MEALLAMELVPAGRLLNRHPRGIVSPTIAFVHHLLRRDDGVLAVGAGGA